VSSSLDSARSVLVVEDHEPLRARLARAFRDRGWDVREARDGNEALSLAREETPECAVVDLRMPGPPGLDVVRGLTALDAATAVVVLTGYGSIATAVEALRLGAVQYLTKPADVDEIIAAFSGGAQQDSSATGDQAAVPSLARVEWEHIQRVLADCGGNVSKAARLLGIHRRSLQRKLSKYPAGR
jgi:two-component system, response regulator RegA